MQVVGGQVGQQFGEGSTAALGRVGGAVCAGAGVSWCGHRLEDLAQERERQHRDGEVPAHGGVVVVVEGEPHLVLGSVFFGFDLVVLGRVDHLRVGLDRLQRTARDAAQLGGVEPGGLLHQLRLDDRTLLVGDPARQRGQCGGDHPGVLRGQRTRRERLTRPGGAIEVLGQTDLPRGIATRAPGLTCDPGTGVGEPLGLRRRGGLATRDHLQLQRLDPTPHPLEVGDQTRTVLDRVDDARVHPVQHDVHLAHPCRQRTEVRCDVECCGHGKTLSNMCSMSQGLPDKKFVSSLKTSVTVLLQHIGDSSGGRGGNTSGVVQRTEQAREGRGPGYGARVQVQALEVEPRVAERGHQGRSRGGTGALEVLGWTTGRSACTTSCTAAVRQRGRAGNSTPRRAPTAPCRARLLPRLKPSYADLPGFRATSG